MDSRRIAALILNLDTSWGKWSTSRSDRFSPTKELRCPANRWLDGSQSQPDVLKSSKSSTRARIILQFLVCAARSLVTVTSELSRLPQ